MAVELTRRRFTVGEYHQMAKSGILKPGDRVELIDGEIVEMTPIGRRHNACVLRANDAFAGPLKGRAIVSVQSPVRLDDGTEPEPDIALLRRKPDFYDAGIPTAADVFLIVEVADSSVEYDRRVKVPLYARAGVPEVWLALIEADHVEVHREPGPTGYRVVRSVRRGEPLGPAAFPDLVLDVAALLG
jgi:Uma2 family endonuclease